MFPCQDRSVGWNMFTPACLCHKLRLISVAPCLPKPRGSGKAVRRARSSKDAVEGVFVCVGRESAVVSLWVEWEVKKRLLPSGDRQAGRRWGRAELEISLGKALSVRKICDTQTSPPGPLHLLRGLSSHSPRSQAIRSCPLCFSTPVYSSELSQGFCSMYTSLRRRPFHLIFAFLGLSRRRYSNMKVMSEQQRN